MNPSKVQAIALRVLAKISNLPGAILYSGVETLKPGDIYLLGFNPGGEGGEPLSLAIDQFQKRIGNAYLDESWGSDKYPKAPGEATLQKRVVWLLNALELEPRSVCASNLIFLRSKEAKDINYELAKQCWPVHEAILEVVKPSVILTFGNSDVSPYAFLKQVLGAHDEISEPSGHGNWKLKSFCTTQNGRNIKVIGIPHLSRYSPSGKQNVLKWLKVQAEI